MEALHGGSSSIPFIVHLFFKISLEAKICQAILKIKHGFQNMLCFEEFKHSSSCIPKWNSFYLIFWGGVMSLLTISLRVSWFNSCQERGILNPSISSLELSWYRFHLKAFPKECCYCGAYQWSKFFLSPWWEKLSIFSLISSKQLFRLVAGCHLIILRCFP